MRRFPGRARFGNVSLSDAPAVTFGVHFQDRGVVNKSIDRRDRHGCVDEDVAPFRERRVCRDGDALALVAFSDEFEEYGGFSLVLADVANIVEDQEIEAIKACNFVREAKIAAGNRRRCTRSLQRIKRTRFPASMSAWPIPLSRWLLPLPGGPNAKTFEPCASQPYCSASAVTWALEIAGTAEKS